MNVARFGRFIAASILALVWGAPYLIAQDSERTGGFHLEMILQRTSGDPIGNLKAEGFWVEQAGSQLQVTIANGGEGPATNGFRGTRLLVILGSSVPDPEKMLHRLTGRFKGIWKLGWESAVVWADGSATDYAAGPASLAQGAPATSSYEQACQAAVANLGDFHGRKLVLYLPGRLKAGKPVILQSGKAKIGSGTGTSFVPVVKRKPGTASVPTPVVQGAARSMAVLYVLDGGEPASFSGSWSTLGPTNGEIVGWPSYGSAHSTFIDGVKHELGSSIAFADMRRDSRGYYDLDLTPQPGYSIDPHQPLSVKIKVRGSFRTVSQADGIGKDLPIEVSQR